MSIITEQRSCLIPDLTENEAAALVKLGQVLRSTSPGFGDEAPSEDTEEDALPTVVQVDRKPGDKGWRVFVRNAVGVIGVDDLQIIVEPKIPLPHFEYLSSLAVEPESLRLADGHNAATTSMTYVASVWVAFLDALSLTFRADLHHEYEEVEDDPPYFRGRLDVRRVATNLSRGALRFPTIYDDLSVDNPVNRILRAACVHVASAAGKLVADHRKDAQPPQQLVYRRLQRRATEASYHLSQAGELRPGDLAVEVPRLAVHQMRAFNLAKHILGAVGRTLRSGENIVSCFLHPTPQIVESGIRRLLDDTLGGEANVSKSRRSAAGLWFNPDLVVRTPQGEHFGVIATGDVKYRIRTEDWPRQVLEQAVMFAEVFQADHGFFVDFDVAASPNRPRTEMINGRHLHRVTWHANEDVAPHDAAAQVVHEIRHRLSIAT